MKGIRTFCELNLIIGRFAVCNRSRFVVSLTRMEKRGKQKSRFWSTTGKLIGVLLGLLLLNRIVYYALLPMIFFHAGFSEEAFDRLRENGSVRALEIPTEHGMLYGWETGENPRKVALYFGGDSIDSNAWLDGLIASGQNSVFQDMTLLTVDYPTFGRSPGPISEQRFLETAETLYSYALDRFPDASMCLIGYSLGCSAALSLAESHTTDGLILIAPMFDGTSMYFPRDSLPHNWFERTASVKLNNDLLATNVSERTLVIYSDSDQITKRVDVEALCALFPTMPTRVCVPPCDHGAYWTVLETGEAIQRFLESM